MASLNQNRTNSNSKFACSRGGNSTSNSASNNQDWQQERQERIAALVAQLEQGVAGIQSSDDFKRWLKWRAGSTVTASTTSC